MHASGDSVCAFAIGDSFVEKQARSWSKRYDDTAETVSDLQGELAERGLAEEHLPKRKAALRDLRQRLDAVGAGDPQKVIDEIDAENAEIAARPRVARFGKPFVERIEGEARAFRNDHAGALLFVSARSTHFVTDRMHLARRETTTAHAISLSNDHPEVAAFVEVSLRCISRPATAHIPFRLLLIANEALRTVCRRRRKLSGPSSTPRTASRSSSPRSTTPARRRYNDLATQLQLRLPANFDTTPLRLHHAGGAQLFAGIPRGGAAADECQVREPARGDPREGRHGGQSGPAPLQRDARGAHVAPALLLRCCRYSDAPLAALRRATEMASSSGFRFVGRRRSSTWQSLLLPPLQPNPASTWRRCSKTWSTGGRSGRPG